MQLLRRKYKLSELYILRKSFFKLILSPKKLINFFLVKVSLFFKMKKCLGLPFNIFIEPTGNCNYRCVKCEKFSDKYVDDGPVFDGKNMPFEYYCRIIDDIGDTLLSLRLWHYGEPFLNSAIFDMVEYAKRKGIVVCISSNLSLLTEESVEKLIQSGLDYLIISFDGGSNKTYNLYHRRDYFNRVVDNIRTLVRSKKRLKSSSPFIELQFIVMKDNEEEMSVIRDLASELNVDKLTYLKLDATKINFDTPEGPRSCADILPENRDFTLDIKAINLINSCRIPWEEAVIRYSGAVLPCVTDISQKYEVGNLFQNGDYLGFRKLWNNIHYRDFRHQIVADINGNNICFNCAQRDNNTKDQI